VNGHAAVVKLLLKMDNINVNVKEKKYGSTALMWATKYGQIAVVKLLLDDWIRGWR
jgi:ankyrin repeat protein